MGEKDLCDCTMPSVHLGTASSIYLLAPFCTRSVDGERWDFRNKAAWTQVLFVRVLLHIDTW